VNALRIEQFGVRALQFGAQTQFADGCLCVNRDEFCQKLKQLVAEIQTINLHVASPGERTRVLCVKDVIEPRIKTSGTQPGQGIVRALTNCAVVTCGPIVGFQEGIIDMNGPGAAHTPFSKISFLVLKLDVAADVGPHEHEQVVRETGLAAAKLLAECTRDSQPDETVRVEWNPLPAEGDLPRIAYVMMVLSQGLLHDTYVLGQDAMSNLPAILDPRAVFDNAVVSGNCVSACDKNTTWHHQHNPVVSELLRGHGSHWNFVGMVVTNEPTRLLEKEQSALRTLQLVQQLEPNGVVVTKEGFGNPDADLMMILRGLEQAGIRAVGVTDEYAGSDGGSQSLADATPEADAIVSTGNANARIALPAMDAVIGDLPDVTRLAGGYPWSVHADGSLEVELQAIVGATNQLGANRLMCCEV